MRRKNKNPNKAEQKNTYDQLLIYHKLDKSGQIEKFREAWNMPARGWLNRQNYYKWRGEFLVKPTNRFLISREYKNLLRGLQNKKIRWAEGKVDRSKMEEHEFKIEWQKPLFKFEYAINAIMTNLKIPERYKAFVEFSLVLKEVPKWQPIDRGLPRPRLTYDPNSRRHRLFIEAYGDTKAEDFTEGFFISEFYRHQRRLYDYGTIKQLGAKNLEIYGKMYDWHFRGRKTYKEVRELAKKEFGFNTKSDENVGTLLNRYKKLLGLYTRKSLK